MNSKIIGKQLANKIGPGRVLLIGTSILTIGGSLLSRRPVLGGVMVFTGILLDWAAFLSTYFEIEQVRDEVQETREDIQRREGEIRELEGEIKDHQYDIRSTRDEIEEMHDRVFDTPSDTSFSSLERDLKELKDTVEGIRGLDRRVGDMERQLEQLAKEY